MSDPAAPIDRTRAPANPRLYYDDWAARYDADNLTKGFHLPFVGATVLARHLAPEAGPVLDGACGTGLVGATLAPLGYALVGCDLSGEMLRAAEATGAYTRLVEGDLAALPFADGAFAGFCAIGAFGPGHAPPAALKELARVTRPGGTGVFSLRHDTYEAQGFPAVIASLGQAGIWRVIGETPPFRAYRLGEPQLLAHVVTVEILA